MTVTVVLEMHSTSVDNEAGVASGWSDPELSATGRTQAKELGERHSNADAVYCSDLRRAVETAEIAFDGRVPIVPDERLRECNYGTLTRAASKQIDAEWPRRIDEPFPGGESVVDVVARVRTVLDELARNYDGKTVVVIGHRATYLSFQNLLGGVALEEAVRAGFTWQPGWTYRLG
jgi:broad specificity phosphatase PhoE